MKQEDKDLLLRDLCARLPYDVKVWYANDIFNIDSISSIYGEIHLDIVDNYTIDVSEVKPYLFPLSSMTEEQKREYLELLQIGPAKGIDYLNKHMFDYRGLIEKGLAIDCTNLNIY
jgi:hypothetical protein